MRVLASVAALMLVQPLSAHAQGSGGSAPEHEGFYFNTDVGPGGSYYHLSGPRDDLYAHGGSASVDFRFGYALTPHLVLSGDLSGSATEQNPYTTLDGYRLHSTGDYQFSSAFLGAGLTWYFDDNMFVGFTAGAGRIALHYGNSDLNSDNGPGVQIRIGKEWWVGDEWGLGIVSGLTYITAGINTDVTVTTPSRTIYTAHFDRADSSVAFVAFSATFN